MERPPNKLLTLVLVHEPPRVLLGMKKTGFGAGWWNGFGGKVQPDETVEAAARRELLEEVGIDVHVLEEVGLLYFEFENDPVLHECHVFRGSGVVGEPVETDEMITPQWFHEDEIPYDRMWKGDDRWVPLFLEGKRFEGTLRFDADNNFLGDDVRTMLA